LSDSDREHTKEVTEQFTRAAEAFSERSRGRFDVLDPVAFSRVEPGQSVIEVGGGSGNFISKFQSIAGLAAIFDLTPAMLGVARRTYPGLALVVADAERLPLASGSADLATTAQALHHMATPVEVVRELRRVTKRSGRVLVVDSVAPDRIEEARAMNELDLIRDPSHVAFRSPAAMKVIVQAAGLDIVDEHLSVEQQKLSQWMWPDEFPGERIEAVRNFIEERGAETGMKFERSGGDWVFERRRLMLLCERAK